MKKFFSLFLICIFLATSWSTVIVKAEDNTNPICFIAAGNEATALNVVCANANNVCGKKILEFNSEGVLSFDSVTYSELDSVQRKDFMKAALLGVRESNLAPKSKNKAYNFIAAQDSTASAAVKYLKSDAGADFVTASTLFKPVSSRIAVVIALLCIAIFAFLGLSIVFDWAYIALPAFRLALTRGDEKNKPFGVSTEAVKSVEEVESGSTYKNVAGLYLKRRLPQILIMAICLSYLISSKIYDIIVFFMDAFQFF